VKKTIAAIGASVLGLAGAAGAAAAPAAAVGTDSCTDATQHQVSTTASDPSSGAWYMDCVPQYGMGKAEFTITPAAGQSTFPAGYSLTDGKQTVVSSSPTAAQVESYFASDYALDHSTPATYTGAFLNLTQDTADSTAAVQQYSAPSGEVMAAAFPITAVTKLASTALLPTDCTTATPTPTYAAAYEVTYAPATTSFSETIGGTKYTNTVTLTAPPLYLGLNFNAGDPFGFDSGEALCASSSLGTVFAPYLNDPADPDAAPSLRSVDAQVTATAAPVGPDAWYTVALDAAGGQAPINMNTLIPTVTGFDDPDGTPISGASFAVAAIPVLATTGVDAAPAGILGASLLLGGTGAFVIGRRRRRNARVS
jgi:hypothetical protein